MDGAGLDGSFWRNKRVFVTGHTGFKGSWLCLLLEQLGAKVTGFSALPPTDPSLFKLADIENTVPTVIGDVRDYGALQKAMKAQRPEVVLHLAAQPLVRYSYVEPLETYSVNVMGTANVLESIRHCDSVRAAVMITSDKCYQNNEAGRGFCEDDPMGGHDPYSSSKGCAELVTSAYRDSFFWKSRDKAPTVGIASARAGNVIGGGDWAKDRLVPDCIRSCAERETIVLRHPMAIRPWQFVLEPLCGYLVLAQRLFADGRVYSSGWNFGPRDEDAQPVKNLVRRLVELWGDGADWQLAGGDHPHEAHYLHLDCAKAHQQLGWRPCMNLDLALEWTVDWSRRTSAGEDPRRVSMEQVEKFRKLEEQSAWKARAADFAKAS